MTAKSPCLDFLITSQRRNEKHDCSLSLIMKKGGGIDDGKFRETRLYQTAPISTNLILSYIAEHVLGMPRSY